MITIPHYQISKKIYDSANSLVYRALRNKDNQAIILKYLKEDYPSPEELTRYRQEYDITHRLADLDGVVKVYSLEKHKNTLVMCMEDFGGESLRYWLAKRQFSLDELLTFAIRATKILGQIHQQNIIHKDINPANLVFNPTTGMLKIIDFGISTVLPRENPTLKNPNQLEGTLAYLSPEQTGRMNRSLDYRTDLYSLGVTFYELLTGKVPFESDSPLELVHCHIAKTPTPVSEVKKDVPPIISDIVMKLMSKNVEDRYQSAFGVKADLEECKLQFAKTAHIEFFHIAQNDFSSRFQIPQKLYGREAEIETLLQAFERVSSGATEMMLVAGYSGVGKTALVREVHKPMTEKQGYFASGKFDQLGRNIPYSAFSEALDEFFHYLLTESPAQLNEWRETLLTAVGNNGQILIEVIPALELIIGKQPPVVTVGSTEAQNRFHRVFQHFILALSQPTHPLILFIDDWQWADSASLSLLTLLLTEPEIQSLLIIGAYRDNEVNAAHPFMITVEELKKAQATIKQIQLGNLSQGDVNALISDTIACNEPNHVSHLTDLVYDKTHGNAFFTLEFFKSLFQKGLLVFDVKRQKWEWDVSKIATLGITDNVVELMAGKINQLPSETLSVLKLAACIGNAFDLETLSIIHQQVQKTTLQHLWKAIEEGLLLPLDDHYKSVGMVEIVEARFRFQHDRVQEAAYSLIADTDKQTSHLQIGRLLLANSVEAQREENLFDIVNQLNEGKNLIDNDSEKRQLAELNLKAGQKAKDATAYAAAQQYINAGIILLNPDSLQQDYPLTFALHKERAEVAYLNGHFDEAEKWIHDAVAQAQSTLEQVELYFLLVKQYAHLGQQEQIIPIVKKALALLEIDVPEEEDLQAALDIEVAELKKQMTQDISGLLEAPETNNPEATIVVNLLWKLLETASATGQETLICFAVAKVARISLKYGAVPESSIGYLSYGMLLSICQGDFQSGYEYVLLGLKLSKKFKRQDYICLLCENVVGNVSFLVKPFKSADPLFHEGYQAGLESGLFMETGYLIMHHVYSLFIRGEQIEQILMKINDLMGFVKKNQLTLIINFLLGTELLLWNLSGKSPEKSVCQTDELDEAQYLASLQEDPFTACIFQIYKSQMFYLYDKQREGHQCALEVEKSIGVLTGMPMAITHNFYDSLNLAALYPDASEPEQPQYWTQLESNQKQMKGWAEGCPENFLNQYLLVEAEMARISGKGLEETMDLYDRAIASARENELVQNEALCNELAAKFWLAKGKKEIAQLYFKKAHYGYQLWGAKRKVEDLEEKYPQFCVRAKTEQEQKIITTSKTVMIPISTTTSQNHSAQLDLESVMKASQTLSGEMLLNRLLEQMMRIVIENAGASIGFLLLPQQEKWFIEAKGQVDSDEVTVLQSLAVEKSEQLSANIIHYVVRTQANVVLHDATQAGHFTRDSYIVKYRPKSVLCAPLINQGKLIGILYLENHLTTGAFTADRLKTLNLLSSQIAISIENSLLYNNLEQKVAERTQELSDALEHLKTAQSQLVESEKMASLGGLVAGVAHEINTPIGIGVTAASTLADRTTETATAYGNKQLKGSALKAYLNMAQSSSNLILNNLNRAAELIQSFKQVAVDQSNLEKRSFAVKEYIKAALINLKPHLKKTPHKITVNGDEQIKLNNYPGAFSQTITNLVMNSVRHAYPKGGAGKLCFELKLDSERLIVEYSDDGCGIPTENRDKIFEPFFTTARAKGGTGLGLHIIFNLVTQKMQGTISVQSEVGVGTTFILNLPLQINNKG